MKELEAAAERGDEVAFIAAYQQVEWGARTAPEFVAAIKLAFKAGAFKVAGLLAGEGAARHPADAALKKYADVLTAPPHTEK